MWGHSCAWLAAGVPRFNWHAVLSGHISVLTICCIGRAVAAFFMLLCAHSLGAATGQLLYVGIKLLCMHRQENSSCYPILALYKSSDLPVSSATVTVALQVCHVARVLCRCVHKRLNCTPDMSLGGAFLLHWSTDKPSLVVTSIARVGCFTFETAVRAYASRDVL